MLLGIDLGYGFAKWKTANGEGMFPSVVGDYEPIHFHVEGQAAPFAFEKPNKFAVGKDAQLARLGRRREDRAWYTGADYQRLLLAALSEATDEPRATVKIATGLPVSNMGDKDAIDAVLSRGYTFKRLGRAEQTIKIEDHIVLPQGYAAFTNLMLDDRGAILNPKLANARVGVLDIGCGTVGILGLDAMHEVPAETGSVPTGTWQLVNSLRAWVETNMPGLRISDHALMAAIVGDRHIPYFGKKVPVHDVVDAAIGQLVDAIVATVTTKWNGGAQFEKAYLVGGGALLLGTRIKAAMELPLTLIKNAQMANTQGYYKYAQRRWG